MAQVRLTHPDHGFDIAYNNADQKRMQENGWKPISDADFKALIAAKGEKAEPVSDAAPVEKKKPGPKAKKL